MRNRGFLFGVIFTLVVGLSLASTNLYNYSVQEALNKIIGAKPHEYTMQQALNVITTRPADRDTLVGLVSWIWDDAFTAVLDSLPLFDATVNPLPCAVGIIGKYSLHEDTTTIMGKQQLDRLYNRGWEMMNHAYDAMFDNGMRWTSADTGRWYSGKFKDEWVYENIQRNNIAITDTLGFPTPRGFVYPALLQSPQLEDAVARCVDYAFGGDMPIGQTGATGTSLRARDPLNLFMPGISLTSPISGTYPGLNAGEYNMTRLPIEGASFQQIRLGIIDAVRKKSWITLYSHYPASVGSAGTHQCIRKVIALIDSLQTAGTIRAVTPSEGFDLTYRTPISPRANWIWPNFEICEVESEALPWMMTAYDSVTFYRDSTYVIDGSDNHGYGSRYGYATLDWHSNASSAFSSGSTVTFDQSDDTWANAGGGHDASTIRKCEWTIPVQGGGRKLIRFEVMAQVDPSIYRPTTNADTMMVSFFGSSIKSYGQGSLAYRTIKYGYDSASYPLFSTQYGNSFGQYALFTDADTVGGSWMQIVATWPVPDLVDVVSICLNKGASLDSAAVRISKPSVHWIDQNPRDRW